MSERDPLADLTLHERRFLEAYLGDAQGNGVKAIELAGMQPNANKLSKSQAAYKMLGRPRMKAAIAELLEHDPAVVGRQERLRLLSAIARGETFEEKLGKDGVVQVQVSAADRLKAMDLLGRAMGETREVNVTIKAETMSDAELSAALQLVGVDVFAAGAAPLTQAIDGTRRPALASGTHAIRDEAVASEDDWTDPRPE